MGFLTPGYAVFIGLLVLLYGVLVGGTWVRRVPGKTWDTVQPIIFIVIAAVATIDLVFLGARQAAALKKAKLKLDCVATQISAIRADLQTPIDAPLTIPACEIAWDED